MENSIWEDFSDSRRDLMGRFGHHALMLEISAEFRTLEGEYRFHPSIVLL